MEYPCAFCGFGNPIITIRQIWSEPDVYSRNDFGEITGILLFTARISETSILRTGGACVCDVCVVMCAGGGGGVKLAPYAPGAIAD
jgi:hypothetical protein